MKSYYEKFISKNELTQKIKEKGIPEEYLYDCIDKFAHFIEENHDFDGYSHDEIMEEINEWFDYSVEKISDFIKEVENGYSREFAKFVAFSAEDGFLKINEAFEQLNKINPEQAVKDLLQYCKNVNCDCDKICLDYFVELMKDGDGIFKPNPLERATKYSQIYNESLAEGKSVDYAKIFAEICVDVDVYNKVFCKCFAKYYIEAKNDGKSETIARIYAFDVSDYFANQYSVFEDIKYDEYDLMNIRKIKNRLKY